VGSPVCVAPIRIAELALRVVAGHRDPAIGKGVVDHPRVEGAAPAAHRGPEAVQRTVGDRQRAVPVLDAHLAVERDHQVARPDGTVGVRRNHRVDVGERPEVLADRGRRTERKNSACCLGFDRSRGREGSRGQSTRPVQRRRHRRVDGLRLLGSERGASEAAGAGRRPAPGGLAPHSRQWLARVVLAGRPGGERQGERSPPAQAPPHRFRSRRLSARDKACWACDRNPVARGPSAQA
jgi:hypothetical protein